MLGNHYIKLLHRFTGNFLIDLNDSIYMIASYSNLIENELEK